MTHEMRLNYSCKRLTIGIKPDFVTHICLSESLGVCDRIRLKKLSWQIKNSFFLTDLTG